MLHGYLEIPNLLALSLKPFVHTRVVWGIRGGEIDLRHYDWLLRLAAQLERLCSPFADLIIVNSVASREHHAARGFLRQKMVVIPNGIDTETFNPDRKARARVRAEWGIAMEAKLIGVVGRLDPMKDLPVFLAAAAQLCGKRNDVRFTCIGPGRARYVLQLQELANNLGLADAVIWPGAYAEMNSVTTRSTRWSLRRAARVSRTRLPRRWPAASPVSLPTSATQLRLWANAALLCHGETRTL